jgi:hypothetical protein
VKIERKCNTCNEIIISVDKETQDQDRYQKLKESIAIFKHKMEHKPEFDKSIETLVEIAFNFASMHQKRRKVKQFELVLDWIHKKDWRHYDEFYTMLLLKIKTQQKTPEINEIQDLIKRRQTNAKLATSKGVFVD